MKVITQSKYDIEVDKSEGKIYIYQDEVDGAEQDCIEVEMDGARQLIEVLQELLG